MKARIMNNTVLSHCSAYDSPRPITFFFVKLTSDMRQKHFIQQYIRFLGTLV